MDTKPKILIIEDEASIADIYRIKLENEGFEVAICSNGLDAVSMVTDYEPALILMDIMMPTMDGFETLRVLKELAPSLKMKIVMFSNLSGKSDIEKCKELGADDYIVKANTSPKEAVKKIKILLGLIDTTNVVLGNEALIFENISPTEKKVTFACPHCEKGVSLIIQSDECS